MQLTIAAIGRMKSGPERELFDRYIERSNKAGGPIHFQGPAIIELPEDKSPQTQKRKDAESAALFAAIPKDSEIFILDERGKTFDSVAFSKLLERKQQDGCSNICFVIGGPDGHGDLIKSKAKTSIAFGSQTWPHQLARIMLAEQIYRAITILTGHPYHRV